MLEDIALSTHRPKLSLSPEAADALASYRWPGNLRELRSALERAATLARTSDITIEDLPDKISQNASSFANSANGTRLREREREYIMRVLANSPNLEQAAATLGINVTTLWRKRKRYEIP